MQRLIPNIFYCSEGTEICYSFSIGVFEADRNIIRYYSASLINETGKPCFRVNLDCKVKIIDICIVAFVLHNNFPFRYWRDTFNLSLFFDSNEISLKKFFQTKVLCFVHQIDRYFTKDEIAQTLSINKRHGHRDENLSTACIISDEVCKVNHFFIFLNFKFLLTEWNICAIILIDKEYIYSSGQGVIPDRR